MANLFMEDLESKAIPTAPAECDLSLWKRYANEMVEKVKRNTSVTFTAHLNTIDVTGNIEFPWEEESKNTFVLIDVKIIRNDDDSI